jgi:hypothetical protein
MYLFQSTRKRISGDWFHSSTLFHSAGINVASHWLQCRGNSYLGALADEVAAASAAALANPCKASIGAFMVDRGKVSSDSSSEEGAVLGTIPYVAYLCGYTG